MTIFWTPQCGSSIVNNSTIYVFYVFVLGPFCSVLHRFGTVLLRSALIWTSFAMFCCSFVVFCYILLYLCCSLLIFCCTLLVCSPWSSFARCHRWVGHSTSLLTPTSSASSRAGIHFKWYSTLSWLSRLRARRQTRKGVLRKSKSKGRARATARARTRNKGQEHEQEQDKEQGQETTKTTQ